MMEPSHKRPRVVLTASRHEGPRAGPKGEAAAPAAADPIALTPVALTPVAKASLQREAPPPAAKASRAAREPPGPRAEAPPAQPKPAQKAPEQGPVAVFDACGTIFKVSAQVVKAKPDTLLAQLLEASSGAPSANRPVFVDCAPDRFSYILDWYRHGEIHMPASVPVEALLLDARSLQLPGELVVNGVTHSTAAASGPGAARKVARGLVAEVEGRWRGFQRFLEQTLSSVASHFQQVGEISHSQEEVFDSYDFPPFVMALYGEKGWTDVSHVCSGPRARMLALKLEGCGYLCEFTDTELLVRLPLRLRGEALAGLGPDAEEPDDGEGLAAAVPGEA